jgi:hypothetical protein
MTIGQGFRHFKVAEGPKVAEHEMPIFIGFPPLPPLPPPLGAKSNGAIFLCVLPKDRAGDTDIYYWIQYISGGSGGGGGKSTNYGTFRSATYRARIGQSGGSGGARYAC